jgi:hypothetical protein
VKNLSKKHRVLEIQLAERQKNYVIGVVKFGYRRNSAVCRTFGNKRKYRKDKNLAWQQQLVISKSIAWLSCHAVGVETFWKLQKHVIINGFILKTNIYIVMLALLA